jgi:uncharacterized protein (DUF2336 family)
MPLLELQDLASSGTGNNQDKILDRVTDLFFLTSESQGEMEKAVFGDVMERIVYELETQARVQLAERLADVEEAPHKLAVKLASDEIGVARPILENSPCLNDDDLVNIAELSGQDHLHAISSRSKLSSKVTDALVVHGNDKVLEKVAGNAGAEFSESGIEQISQRAQENFDLFSILDIRSDIPKETLSEIKRNIAVRLWTEVSGSSSGISGQDVDAIVETKASEMNLGTSPRNTSASAQKKIKQSASESMVLSLARSRKQAETIQCLSLMSGISFTRVSHCLMDADLSALAVLCKSYRFKILLLQHLSNCEPPPPHSMSGLLLMPCVTTKCWMPKRPDTPFGQFVNGLPIMTRSD